MSANPYRDPRAMRNAIADRLRPLARERGIQLGSLQRQFAYADPVLSEIAQGQWSPRELYWQDTDADPSGS